jgi:GMP synthase-like glutamine amidotransferase
MQAFLKHIMSIRIAIILTNTDHSAFAQSHPNDGEKVAACLRATREHWSFTVWRAIDGRLPPNLEGIDGVVFTGSPASVNDDEAWIEQTMQWIRTLHHARIPTVGLCFGHQLIAKALGGKVERAASWGLGLGQVRLVQRRAWMQPYQDNLTLFAVHQDQVVQLPPDAEVLGGSHFCPIGCYTVGTHMLATQFHPEMPRAFLGELLDVFSASFPADAVSKAKKDIEQHVDSELFFHWIAHFIEQAHQTHA